MVKVRVNMKNGDKWMIKLEGASCNDRVDKVLEKYIYSDYNRNSLNIHTYDLVDYKYGESTSIAIIVDDISSIEYGF